MKRSFLEINNGEIIAKADYELQRVIENINDINTDPTKAREITIKISFKANESRTQIFTTAHVSSKIQNTKKIEATLFNVNSVDRNTGESVSYLQEATPIVPGQIDLFGNVQAEGAKYFIGQAKEN